MYLIAGRLAQGVAPAAAITGYLGSFSGQELHLTTEPAGPLGGAVKCWAARGTTFCMWADDGTYGVLDYQPPLGLDATLIHHLAGVVPGSARPWSGGRPDPAQRGSRSPGRSTGKP